MPSRRIYLLPVQKTKRLQGEDNHQMLETIESILTNTTDLKNMLTTVVKFNASRLHIGTLNALTEYVYSQYISLIG